MKKCIAIVVVCLLSGSILAGPFGLFGGRRSAGNCGPNGCFVPQTTVSAQVDAQPRDGVVPPPQKQPELIHPPAKDAPLVGNFGIVEEGRGSETKITTQNGREITVEEARVRVADSVPDDSKKFRLVAIGTAEQRKPVADAYASLETPLKDRIAPWFVGADDYSLKDTTTGKTIFVTTGTPTVYLQAPDGKVLLRSDEWKGETTIGAIRKATKDYDAKKDPDGKTPIPGLPSNIPWGWIVIGVLVALFLYQHNKEKS